MAEFFFSRRLLGADGKFSWQPSAKPTYAMIERWLPNGSPARILTSASWARSVLASAKSNEVLIVVHGFNVMQNTFLGRIAKMRASLQASGFKGAVVGFDWPANGRSLDYKKDREDAKLTGPSLVWDGVDLLLKHNPGVKVHVLAHSMGCYATSIALASATGTVLEPKLKRSLKEVVFIGADVDVEWTKPGAWAAESLRRCCGRFTSYGSIHDVPLQFSENNGNPGTKRIGRAGLTHPASETVVDVDGGDYYLNSYRFQHGWLLSHGWYFTDPVFRRDFLPVLAGQSPATQTTRRRQADGHYQLVNA